MLLKFNRSCMLLALSFVTLAGGAVETSLDELVASRAAVEQKQRDAKLSPIVKAGVQCFDWYAIGPFKDAEYGIFAREFDTVFEPEKDVLERAGQLAQLDKTYQSVSLPGALDGSRNWVAHPEWTDGYYNQLPSGPPPGRNEVMYLYRTITCDTPIDITGYLATLDATKIWLNGKAILNAPIREGWGQRFLQKSFNIPLDAGANRLLVKIVKCFQKNGFSFAIDTMHPIHPLLKAKVRSWQSQYGFFGMTRESAGFDQTYKPYASAVRQQDVLSSDLSVSRDAKQKTLITRQQKLDKQLKLFDQSLKKLRSFRFEVEPLPTFDPAELTMQKALDKLEPTQGGAAYMSRLKPVLRQARAALLKYEAGEPGAGRAVIEAAEALDRFKADSIRAVGPILFVRHPGWGRMNMQSSYTYNNQKLNYNVKYIYSKGTSPSSIAVFDPARPKQEPRVIYADRRVAIWQASLSYDAKTVFFAARHGVGKGSWNIYEIGVDGKNLKAITSSSENNIAPIELPSGKIAFVSDRAGNMNVCQANRAGVIYVCDRDGSNVHRISANTLTDHTPAVMNDGSIMFTRWDYGVDKGVFQRHGVWTMNPDGTHLQLYFGNTILDPDGFWQCVPVPGRPEVVSTFGGHHFGPYGVFGLLWNRLGIEAPRGRGFRFVNPEYPTYFDDDFWYGYVDPHPLNENEFLVSYGGDGGRKNRIYYLDNHGNKTCIWEEAGNLGCFNPLALRPRKRPPVIPAASEPVEFKYVDPVIANICPDDSIQGTLILIDVYEGLTGHVKRGEIKSLQIMEQVPKTRPHTGGTAWSISPLIGRGTFDVRRLIGTVPVEKDGSAYFTVPALHDISFNALDAEGRVIQKMGSTTQVMPGEQFSCIGCHVYERTPSSTANSMPLAIKRAPSVPQPGDWNTSGLVDYVKMVQPVWDKHCIKCHSGPQPKGNLDLSGDKTRYFNMSYDMLVDRGLVHHIPQNEADHDLTTPKSNGSVVSRVVTGKYLEPEHYDVVLAPNEKRRIYTWIDANIPYYHTYLYTDGGQTQPNFGSGANGARDRWYDDLPNGWFQKDFAPAFMRRCYDCHKRTIDYSSSYVGRKTTTVTSKVWNDIAVMGGNLGPEAENSVAMFGPEYRINLSHPEFSQMLTAPLASESGGLGLCKNGGGKAIFKDKADADYRLMLEALSKGKVMLEKNPRVDMLPRPDPANPHNYVPSLKQPRVIP